MGAVERWMRSFARSGLASAWVVVLIVALTAGAGSGVIEAAGPRPVAAHTPLGPLAAHPPLDGGLAPSEGPGGGPGGGNGGGGSPIASGGAGAAARAGSAARAGPVARESAAAGVATETAAPDLARSPAGRSPAGRSPAGRSPWGATKDFAQSSWHHVKGLFTPDTPHSPAARPGPGTPHRDDVGNQTATYQLANPPTQAAASQLQNQFQNAPTGRSPTNQLRPMVLKNSMDVVAGLSQDVDKWSGIRQNWGSFLHAARRRPDAAKRPRSSSRRQRSRSQHLPHVH